ncbi:MAG: hypothetical protein DI533_00145 [Cereibacter sphaeroides]|uniref:Uncharacterized protein n=1 Tax=Cereibacter sphaeroides TaxID=1063 RepID=A0A2W5S866_CERSP|nr:MAG: hypothetical protein DI533_00145 [Cereibacter sphaeroides]
MRHLAFAAAALVALSAMPASASYMAINGIQVFPEKGGRTFDVPLQSRTTDQSFWCAAGDYVLVGLRLPGKTPIYRIGEPPRKAGGGMRFSLDPAGAASKTGVTIFSNSGPKNSVSASIARNLCGDDFPFFGF